MAKSSSQQVVDFLIEIVSSLLPKSTDDIAKSVIGVFRDQSGNLLKKQHLKRELLEATQKAESNFKELAKEQLKNDELTQAVASFPLFDRKSFQSMLRSLPEHLKEEYLAQHVEIYITDDRKGKFTPAELCEGITIYLNCLRKELLKVDGYTEIIAQFATLRIDAQTAQIDAKIEQIHRTLDASNLKDGSKMGGSRSVEVHGDVINSTLITGDGNVVSINIDSKKIVTALFTVPKPVQDFTGREKELEQLRAVFLRGAVITGVSGGGGIGKTELARKLADEIKDDYPDARMSIDLLGTSEVPLSSEKVMRQLLEPFYPNQKLPDEFGQLKGIYQQTFSTRKALLVLDNAANAAQVRPLIPPAPSITIITSRRYFSLTEFGLKEPFSLDVLSVEESRRLLSITSAKLLEVPDEDKDRISRLCGYLPLALRVVSSLLNDHPDWTIEKLLSRLENEQTRLQSLRREDDQDLDVIAALSLSYQLLDPDLQRCFRGLGVFSAPFWKRSAEVVLGMKQNAEFLDRLVSRNLVNLKVNVSGYGNEYYLHDLTRLYAMMCLLAEEKEMTESQMNYANHYFQLAEEAIGKYQKGNQHIRDSLNLFHAIWPHISSAWEYINTQAAQSSFVFEKARWVEANKWLSNFPGMCIYVFDLYLPRSQQLPILQTALDAAIRLDDKTSQCINLCNLGIAYSSLGKVHEAIQSFEKQLAISRDIANLGLESKALGNLGSEYIKLGKVVKGVEYQEKSLKIAQYLGDHRDEAISLNSLGGVYIALGDIQKAIKYRERALDIVQEICEKRLEGKFLGDLGYAYNSSGDSSKAIKFYEQALSIAHELGDRQYEVDGAHQLGNVYDSLGEFTKAIGYYEQALTIAREIGDRPREVEVLGRIGWVRNSLGEFPKAVEYYEQALTVARELGIRHEEGMLLGYLGYVNSYSGKTHEAIELYEYALVIAREIGNRKYEGEWLGQQGYNYNKLHNSPKAIEYLEKALAIAREMGSRRDEGKWLGQLGYTHNTLSDSRKAIEYINQALNIARELADRQHEGEWLGQLGIVYRKLGDSQNMIRYYKMALDIALEIGDKKQEMIWLNQLRYAYGSSGKILNIIKYHLKKLKIWVTHLTSNQMVKSGRSRETKKH